MRVLEGVGTLVQLGGMVARLCKLVCFLPLVYQHLLTPIGLSEHETRVI